MEKELYNPTKPFNDQIRKLIQDTHPEGGPIILTPCGKRFSFNRNPEYWKGYEEMRATDGIGTKGLLHWLMFKLTGDVSYVAKGVHDVAGMVWDDHIEGGFEPYEQQDHIMMQEENDEAIFALIKELRDLSIDNSWEIYPGSPTPIIISGGETAIINTIQGFEMGITATGKVRKGERIVPCAKTGDVIIGIESSGIHSNGLTFFRDELFEKRRMHIDSILSYGS